MSQIEDDAPKTVREVGVHLSYVRRDITTLTKLVEQLPNGFASKSGLSDAIRRIEILENTKNSWWVRYGLPALWSLVGAVTLFLVLSFLNQLRGQ